MYRFLAYIVLAVLCLSEAQAYVVRVRSDQDVQSEQDATDFARTSVLVELIENGRVLQNDTISFPPLMGVEREKAIPYYMTPDSQIRVSLVKHGGLSAPPITLTGITIDTKIYVYVTKTGCLEVGKDEQCPWRHPLK